MQRNRNISYLIKSHNNTLSYSFVYPKNNNNLNFNAVLVKPKQKYRISWLRFLNYLGNYSSGTHAKKL